METYNILQGKKIVSTVNVDNIEQALSAAADFAHANKIKAELKVKQVTETATSETTETETTATTETEQ